MSRARLSRLPLAAALAAALLAAGCATKERDVSGDAPAMPAAWAGTPGAEAAEAAIPARWWELYGDATLTSLVDGALAANTDVRFAVAQLLEAEGALREAGANLYPQVNLGATATRNAVSTVTATPLPPSYPSVRNDRLLTAGTSYELDFFGRVRDARDAARSQMLSTSYATDVVRLTVAGSVAQSYFALRSVDAQLRVTRETVRSREETLEVVRSRARGGLASDLDVRQAEGAVADAAALLVELRRQRFALEHQLGQLAGRPDLSLPAGDLDSLPVAPVPPAGLPSSLLLRRPDVRAAEQLLVASDAKLDIARKAFLPTISLTALLGAESAELADLLTAGGRIWTLAFGLAQPIFDGGRISARVDQADARRQQAVAAYQKSAQTAYREVADALTNTAQSADAEAEVRRSEAAATAALRLARLRYEAGYSPYLEVLESQRTENLSRLALVRARQARLSYGVDLMKALGGGWAPRNP